MTSISNLDTAFPNRFRFEIEWGRFAVSFGRYKLACYWWYRPEMPYYDVEYISNKIPPHKSVFFDNQLQESISWCIRTLELGLMMFTLSTYLKHDKQITFH